jgi:hypothetical protein
MSEPLKNPYACHRTGGDCEAVGAMIGCEGCVDRSVWQAGAAAVLARLRELADDDDRFGFTERDTVHLAADAIEAGLAASTPQ